MPTTNPLSEPCVMIIFGASGDLTKRLLVPALYNLACDELLSDNFAVLGVGRSEISDSQFRESMTGADDGLPKFHTRKAYDQPQADKLINRFHFQSANIAVEDFKKLKERVAELDARFGAQGNVLFYFAMAPRFFGPLCDTLHSAGFQDGPGWKRIIVEKPFGTDLPSALKLNDEILRHWREDQIFRVDHYLGKETVQNLLAFRFSNGVFEPLWNNRHIDNIQFNVCESVDVQGRGGYYDSSGVLRDMIQNHMFQMLSYLCMEPPGSFEADSIRNEKAKLLESVRIYKPEEVPQYVVRGQYGPSFHANGELNKPGYRQEKDVKPDSGTDTFAAIKLHIDNWRWSGVPIYLRSGKALWKRGTEIVVTFKPAPAAGFRGTQVEKLEPNRLIFHIQPKQGIELVFQAKVPGPTMQLQKVDMSFNYGNAFKASRYTGYEVMFYSCMRGDATLFSRGDLVKAAWEIAQPLLDYWKATPPGDEFPNYARNSWGPPSASALVERDGQRWYEVITPEVLEQLPLFKGGEPVFLNAVIMALQSHSFSPGETIIKAGDTAGEMYLICRGSVEVTDTAGRSLKRLSEGEYFGEIGLLMPTPRTANVKAITQCDLFVLDRSDFHRIMRDNPQFADSVAALAKERYNIVISGADLMRA
ncbi:MAG: glucose-6-phosphate dehydrogenase [Opitutaceae bacterium]|jgi:glucose-6-phosphate 1-dehydrogenase